MTQRLRAAADLPVPVDDGACAHSRAWPCRSWTLESSVGPVDLARSARSARALRLSAHRPPGRAIPAELERDPRRARVHAAVVRLPRPREELRALGVKLAGLSAQTLEEQVEISERLGLYPVIADPELRSGTSSRLPTFEFEGAELYKRVTLVFAGGRIAKVFYPVFPPDRNAEEVVAWLGS